MTPVSNALSAARLTVSGMINTVTSTANALQRKFVKVTDDMLPKPLAPLFRNLVTSLPITYTILSVPASYTLLAGAGLFLFEVVKDIGGEPRVQFPGPELQRALNNGAGGAFVYWAAKRLFVATKTLWKVGAVNDPIAKAVAICGLGFLGSYCYSRKTKPFIGTLGSSSPENVQTINTRQAHEKVST